MGKKPHIRMRTKYCTSTRQTCIVELISTSEVKLVFHLIQPEDVISLIVSSEWLVRTNNELFVEYCKNARRFRQLVILPSTTKFLRTFYTSLMNGCVWEMQNHWIVYKTIDGSL